jgi:hypothetical protein
LTHLGLKCNGPGSLSCTTWVHGNPPQRLSFFKDKLFGFIEALGRAGVGGHEKVETKGKEVFESGCEHFKNLPDEIDSETEEALRERDFFSGKSPIRLGESGVQWRRVNYFFNDLEDYLFERKSVLNQESWRKKEIGRFEEKVAQKNRSSFRFKALSWDEAI